MPSVSPVGPHRITPARQPAPVETSRRDDALRSKTALQAEEDRRQARTGAEAPQRGANLDVLA